MSKLKHYYRPVQPVQNVDELITVIRDIRIRYSRSKQNQSGRNELTGAGTIGRRRFRSGKKIYVNEA